MITIQAIDRLTKDPILKKTEIENEKIEVCEFTFACYENKNIKQNEKNTSFGK